MKKCLLLFAFISTFASISRSDETTPRIINGTPTNGYPAVGLIGERRQQFCTGTLIAPDCVLTAAHCAEGVGNTDGTFEVNGQTYNTKCVHIHPDYNSFLIGTNRANDIAIFKLDRNVTGVTPIPIHRNAPAVGEELTIVGFGAGGDDNGEDGTFGVKMEGDVEIDDVTSTLVWFFFDVPGESNTAPGDSGGPGFFRTPGGDLSVACITSGGTKADAGFGDRAYNTRVDAYQDWVDSIVTSGECDGGGCGVTSAARAIKQRFRDIDIPFLSAANVDAKYDVLRSFRDRTIRNTAEGRELVDSYYAQGEAMKQLWRERPELALSAIQMTAAAFPAIKEAVSGGVFEIDLPTYEQGMVLIEEFEGVANGEFQNAIQKASSFLDSRAEVRNGKVTINFGKTQASACGKNSHQPAG